MLALVLGLTLALPRLVIEPGLLARLQTLAAGLKTEVVLCLTGTQYGDSTVANGFMMPDPRLSSSDRANFGACPKETVALWHNHPADPNLTPRTMCALSETDVRTAAGGAQPFIVISVDRDTWCWWSREQVRNLATRNALRGDPVIGQISTYQGTAGRIY